MLSLLLLRVAHSRRGTGLSRERESTRVRVDVLDQRFASYYWEHQRCRRRHALALGICPLCAEPVVAVRDAALAEAALAEAALADAALAEAALAEAALAEAALAEAALADALGRGGTSVSFDFGDGSPTELEAPLNSRRVAWSDAAADNRARFSPTPSVASGELHVSADDWCLVRLSGVATLANPPDRKSTSVGIMDVTLKLSQHSSVQGGTHSELTVDRCVALLGELQIASSVSWTLSSVQDDPGGWRAEPGVRIDAYGVDKKKIGEELWPRLKNDFGLECMHVRELGRGFNGCVFDWMRDTACPAAMRRRARAHDPPAGLAGAGHSEAGVAPLLQSV